MKTYWPDFCIIFVATFLLAACKPYLEKELCKAESLSAMHPDSTYVILGNINRENLQDDECRQLYDLAWAEAYYIKSKTVPDSINAVLSRINFKPDTRYSLTKDILQAIHIYKRGDVQEAFSRFETCWRKADSKVCPYWKMVVEDYLGIICLKKGIDKQARGHFYKVLEHARFIGDKDMIVKAHSHLTYYYSGINQLDSALHYAFMVLENCNKQDSQMVAIAYNNVASIHLKSSDGNYPEILNMLKKSLQYGIGTKDSVSTYRMMAEIYYLLGKPDSAYIYQTVIERSNRVYVKRNLYKFLTDYYQQRDNSDSTHKYYGLHSSMESLCPHGKPVENMLNTIHENNLRDVRQDSNLKQALTIIISIVLSSLAIIGVSFRYRVKIAGIFNSFRQILAKQKQEVADARQVNHSLNKELDSMRGQLHDSKSELQNTLYDKAKLETKAECEKQELNEMLESVCGQLQETKSELQDTKSVLQDILDDKAKSEIRAERENKRLNDELESVNAQLQDAKVELSDAAKKAERYQQAVSNRNSQLAKANRKLEKQKKIMESRGDTVVKELLDKSVPLEPNLTKDAKEYYVSSYAESSAERKYFVQSLRSYAPKLTLTGFIICILYKEEFSDKEMKAKFNNTHNEFKSNKSRARKAIEGNSSAFIQNLLRKFDANK